MPPTCATRTTASSMRSMSRSRPFARPVREHGSRCHTSSVVPGPSGAEPAKRWPASRRPEPPGMMWLRTRYPYTAPATTLAIILPAELLGLGVDECVEHWPMARSGIASVPGWAWRFRLERGERSGLGRDQDLDRGEPPGLGRAFGRRGSPVPPGIEAADLAFRRPWSTTDWTSRSCRKRRLHARGRRSGRS